MRTSFVSILTAAMASLVLVGCGEEAEVRTKAETEGLWVNLGAISYQVQISRELNPADVEDRSYLDDLAPADAKLAPGETLFAVFLQAKNESGGSSSNSKRTEPTAEEIEIVDTQGNSFEPLPIGPKNPFAYRPANLGPEALLPPLDSAAANAPTQGALLLFKLDQKTLQNRPLELKLESPVSPGKEAVVDLDV